MIMADSTEKPALKAKRNRQKTVNPKLDRNEMLRAALLSAGGNATQSAGASRPGTGRWPT
jgi:hypothetical protein